MAKATIANNKESAFAELGLAKTVAAVIKALKAVR